VLDGSDAPGAATVLVGTGRAERLVASGHDVTIRARGERDDVLVDDSWSARVWAGPGRDRVAVSGDDVVVQGQGGADRLRLLGTAGLAAPDRARRQQVSLGGRGNDVMVGTAAAADRLVGGAGRDRADGGRGRRDQCDAEVVRRCER
jgi:Ca2+-binding RTX toxin-like protein